MRRLPLALLATGLSAGLASAALTDNFNANITLTGGQLSVAVTGSVSYPTTSLTGQTQTVADNGTVTINMVDATGTGNGWNVTLTGGDFSDGGSPAVTIPASGHTFTATGGTITTNAGNTAPTETGNTVTLNATGGKIITAAAGNGMGDYDYAPATGKFQLVIPADQKLGGGTFTATLTATIASGP